VSAVADTKGPDILNLAVGDTDPSIWPELEQHLVLGQHVTDMSATFPTKLLGNKSIVSSKLFRYVFPHANVSYIDSLMDSHPNLCHGECAESSYLNGKSNEYAQTCLDAVMDAVWKDDDHNEFCGDANSYKTAEGKVVFLTQAELYRHHGPAFAHYSQLEFECIVQLQEKIQGQEKVELSNKFLKDHGHTPRPTFPLGINHPLYTSHVGVIGMKMCTPMFAGAPPLKFPGNKPTKDESTISKWNKEMNYYSKYPMVLCVPWMEDSCPLFERSTSRFCSLINEWNKTSATFIEQQHFCVVSNFMKNGYWSSHNEVAASAWRQPNADWWSEMKKANTNIHHHENSPTKFMWTNGYRDR
jgi:hypothetical protein